ncbi:pheromone-regulated membrane protein [Plectosphaerella cucumerina]|uniref:Pheromone-regulated membrane protein n=1 Tax=Plectosphaerella cucumerina TaxID=40658 RepID=A0A8K0WZM1_9PEZI|nr:pheromone-regulated membrane protein [Plectosphaerella cucumerina]
MSSSNQDSGGSATRDLSPGGGPASPRPARKEKKRVGFSGAAEPSSISPNQTPSPEKLESPQPDNNGDNGPEPAALRRALTQILVTEADGHQTTVATPARPRPVLRRNTSYDAPEEHEKANMAERTIPERQQRSGAEARQRADRLAVRVEHYSAPPSRRNSNEMTATRIPTNMTTDDDDEADDEGISTGVRREELRDDSQIIRSRSKRTHDIAEQLVRSHTRRGRKETDPEELFNKVKREEGALSRPGTPTEEQAYVHDYVPPPDQYRGGILSSLLRLYNDGKDSGDNSGRTTPATATPNPSPPHSRSSSRGPPSPSSAPGTPRPQSRASSGFFGYHQKSGSKSSLALAELMKSTSALMAPGSAGMSGGVSEKIKKEGVPKEKKRSSGTWSSAHAAKEKKKREKIRITKHIAETLARHKYLEKLCRALMMFGAPTHRLEEYMAMSARVLEIEGQFLYMPNCMIISFDDSSTHTTEIKIVRIRQGLDLGKLRDVHDLYKEVVHDRMGVVEATVELDRIIGRSPKFNTWIRIPMYGFASMCVAPFAFQGRFIDLPIAFLLGCILGFLQLILAPNNELYANVFEITAAIITSFLARAFGSIRGGELFCFSALAQSSIALILPGYMVLCSSLELQSHNLISGSVRMVYAMIYTLFLGYGITIGTALYGIIDRDAVSSIECQAPLGRPWYFLFVPLFTICLCLVNQAKYKQMPVMVFISLAGWAANSYTADVLAKSGQTQISNMLGAFVVGILANLYSRTGRHFNNAWYACVDWYQDNIHDRWIRRQRRKNGSQSYGTYSMPMSDLESRPGSPNSSPGEPAEKMADENPTPRRRQGGYGLAAAAMLPAIFVQVPSGLAASGSLLAGVQSADSIIRGFNGTEEASGPADLDLNGSAFNVLFAVIQVAIGITVGLFLSALVVYPFGKRRSGLLSF